MKKKTICLFKHPCIASHIFKIKLNLCRERKRGRVILTDNGLGGAGGEDGKLGGERGLVDMNGGEEDNREGRGDRNGHGLADTILTCQNSKFYTYA